VLIITFSWGFQLGGHLQNSYINTAPSTSFLAPLPGRKRISARGVSRFQSFYFVIVLLYFIFACIFLSKIQKN
jgi:hypothetical protein